MKRSRSRRRDVGRDGSVLRRMNRTPGEGAIQRRSRNVGQQRRDVIHEHAGEGRDRDEWSNEQTSERQASQVNGALGRGLSVRNLRRRRIVCLSYWNSEDVIV